MVSQDSIVENQVNLLVSFSLAHFYFVTHSTMEDDNGEK